MRNSLVHILDEAERDPAVNSIVITGPPGSFATGAGLSETVLPDTPTLAEVCDRCESSSKPVVVAISGPALGGGLELALAAHLRVATPTVRLGAPDITIGLVPNAGGTQRLPKVIGGVAALKLLLSGKGVTGEAAQKIGLVDVLAGDELLETAISNARSLAESGGVLRRSSTRRDRLGEGTAFLEAVAGYRKAAQSGPLDAPARMFRTLKVAALCFWGRVPIASRNQVGGPRRLSCCDRSDCCRCTRFGGRSCGAMPRRWVHRNGGRGGRRSA